MKKFVIIDSGNALSCLEVDMEYSKKVGDQIQKTVLMCYEIEKKNPSVMRGLPHINIFDDLSVLIVDGKFDLIIKTFGKEFCAEMMLWYADREREEYEVAGKIKKSLEKACKIKRK